jgi:hypothetical protein
MQSPRDSCQILIKLEFSRQIFEKKKYSKSNFTKIGPVGAQLFHTDVQTNTKKIIIVFRNFAVAPNKRKHPCSQRKSNPSSQQSRSFRPAAFDRTDNGIGHLSC